MKIIKIIVSFLLFTGIIVLMVWAGFKTKEETCTHISILIHSSENSKLLSKSDILHILKQNKIECEGKTIKEIDLPLIHKILSQENYIKSVDKSLFLGSKLQIEITLYDILLVVNTATGEKFLLDVNGTCLPYSPKVGNDVIIARGFIPNSFQKKATITPNNNELYEIFSVASLIQTDPFYVALYRELYINEKQEIIIYPVVGNLPVLFGASQDAPNKLKSLKCMYKDVLPYMKEDQYAQLDVRFKNRIIATKTKS
ncbi:MAG: hypothetical protein FWH59_02660 [Lentimicrobiaceae bacterium]|nr:hypothetical protein [Lentimicrobiaceae bacterium]